MTGSSRNSPLFGSRHPSRPCFCGRTGCPFCWVSQFIPCQCGPPNYYVSKRNNQSWNLFRVMLLFLIQLDIVMLIGLDALIHNAQRTIFILLGAPLLSLATTRNVSLRQRLRWSETTKEMVWIHRILQDFRLHNGGPIIIKSDNQGGGHPVDTPFGPTPKEEAN
jgi:hypothetical protein